MVQDEPVLQAAVQLKTFLTITACPPRWHLFDLYLIHDEQVAFYVGQSVCAFDRVWEHIKGGPHGHSLVGRFILCNWPRSARFTVDLMSSQMARFASVRHNLNASEQALIEEWSPCFNVSLNSSPTPLPAGYLPPNASIKYLKNFRRMLREAGYAARGSKDDMEW